MARVSIVFLAVLSTGCVHFGESLKLVNSSVLTDRYYSEPLPPNEVDVFLAGDELPESCERVALIRAAPVATVVDRVREEAGRLGANAVDLRDFRYGTDVRGRIHDDGWNVMALHCP